MNLFETRDYRKHTSSYFQLPAGLVVVLAYFLPGILGMIHSGLSSFASLVLIVVSIFEKRSEMVKFYCLQFCFFTMFFNIILSVLSLLGMIVPLIQPIQVICSLIIAVVVVVSTIYSLVCAIQYKAWIIPYVGPFVFKVFFKK